MRDKPAALARAVKRRGSMSFLLRLHLEAGPRRGLPDFMIMGPAIAPLDRAAKAGRTQAFFPPKIQEPSPPSSCLPILVLASMGPLASSSSPRSLPLVTTSLNFGGSWFPTLLLHFRFHSEMAARQGLSARSHRSRRTSRWTWPSSCRRAQSGARWRAGRSERPGAIGEAAVPEHGPHPHEGEKCWKEGARPLPPSHGKTLLSARAFL